MARICRVVQSVFCLLLLVTSTLSQVQSERRAAQKAPANRTKKENEINPLAAQRRTVAISLLTSLAEDARSYQDLTLRARIQARTADALWDTDVERARALFRRAWETASAADKEAWARYAAERQQQATARTQTYVRAPPDLTGEVLQLSSRRDQALSEEFLSQLSEEAKAEIGPANSAIPPTLDPENPPLEVIKRLQLARQLLESGDIVRSLAFADQALDRVTTRGIFYLCALREKNQTEADQRFARLLANTALDPSSDAVSVSVLSSYVFTPFLYIIVRGNGQNHSSQERERIVAPNVPPELRAGFLKGAAAILLRPVPPPDQDRTIAGKRGLYFTIARLLPLFEQHAADLAPELRVQLAALGGDVPDDLRTGRDSLLTRGLLPVEQMRDEGQEALERADRAPNSVERDQAYVRAAMVAARKGEVNARDSVEKIGDTDLRKRTRAYVDFTLVSRAIDRKDPGETLKLLATAELTDIQRVWALLEVAGMIQKTEPARSVELVDEAAVTARRISGTDPDRARALVGVATRMFDVDHGRVWEAVLEATKAANSTSGFSGEDAQIVARFQSGRGTSTTNFSVDAFDLRGVFGLLAKDDLYRAIELAKSFTADAPKAAATLAIARSVLTQRNGSRRANADGAVTNP
jgi:hypothetical protein